MKSPPKPAASTTPEMPASNLTARTSAGDGGLVALGWTALLFYLTCGIGLEALHGLKLGWYLDVGHETRRLMLTLGHAHGTLLAVITLVAGLGGRLEPRWAPGRGVRVALRMALGLVPGGFLLAGIGVRGGDPGPAVWLVPVGAGALLYAVARLTWQALRGGRE